MVDRDAQFRDRPGSQLMRTCYRSPPPCAVVVVTRPEGPGRTWRPPARCEHYCHQAPCRLIADLYRRLLAGHNILSCAPVVSRGVRTSIRQARGRKPAVSAQRRENDAVGDRHPDEGVVSEVSMTRTVRAGERLSRHRCRGCTTPYGTVSEKPGTHHRTRPPPAVRLQAGDVPDIHTRGQ
jgi:hypothetical protein